MPVHWVAVLAATQASDLGQISDGREKGISYTTHSYNNRLQTVEKFNSIGLYTYTIETHISFLVFLAWFSPAPAPPISTPIELIRTSINKLHRHPIPEQYQHDLSFRKIRPARFDPPLTRHDSFRILGNKVDCISDSKSPPPR